MNDFSPGPNSLLSHINYATPVVLAGCYTGTTVADLISVHKEPSKPLPKWRHRVAIILSFIVTLSYAGQAIQYVPYLRSAPDDGLVHAISQTLLWTTLSLIIAITTSPSIQNLLAVSTLNVVLQVVICVMTWLQDSSTDSGRHQLVQHVLQIGTCILLTFFASYLLILVIKNGGATAKNDETQSLLSKRSKRSHSSSSRSNSRPVQYQTLDDAGEACDSSEESDTDSDADDEEKEEEEMSAARQQRLREKGSWINYLAEYRVFLPYLIPQKDFRLRFYMFWLLFNTLIMRALNVLHPIQLGRVIDAFTTSRTIPWKQIVLWIALEVAASYSAGVGAISETLENRLTAWSKREISVASFEHVMGLSMSFHDAKDSGEIIRAIEQASCLSALLKVVVLEIAPGIIDITIAMWYVTHVLDVYALLIIVAVAIGFVTATYCITKLATVARRLSSSKERESSKVIYESISNWFTISYFNRQPYTMAKLARVMGEVASAEVWSNDVYNLTFAAQEYCEYLGRLALSLLAAHRIVTGRTTVGDFVALQNYWATITMPLYMLSYSYRRLNSDLVDAERLLQLFQHQPSVKDSPDAQPLVSTTTQGAEITFEDISFAYPGRTDTLSNINFTVRPGQTVAFVGETGSGKSTLLKLLMRFHDVTPGGSISVDGQNITLVTMRSLRDQFGFVPQDTVLFNATILENVRYARLDATDQECHAACVAASIHDKILSFPQGYGSKVGERGVKLSGGERQRIAIARVFLKNPRVVLLDEATSAMDSGTEAKIQDSLRDLLRGRTAFVIAHRLSTIVEADCIFVVDQGRIVERGTHEELLKSRSPSISISTSTSPSGDEPNPSITTYRDLWRKQAALVQDHIPDAVAADLEDVDDNLP